MKTERTKEQKAAYMKSLRENWLSAKKLLADGQMDDIQAIISNHGMNISATGFMFVSIQMKQNGLDGLPYLDAKTYKGWKQNGYQVRRGEKSVLSGITWVSVDKQAEVDLDDKENTGFVFPKKYHLFHRSQVDDAA